MRRKSMKKIREIIRLSCESSMSNRQIARSLKVSRPVVAQYIINFKRAGLSYEDIKNIDDECLLDILEMKQKAKSERYKILSGKFEYFAKELKRVGVKLQTLWEEYRVEYPAGYSYAQFCYHYQVWRNGSELSMHMEHKAGDKMFADFTGKKLKITDRETMQETPVEVFVALLGASQYTYVEGVIDQGKDSWIRVNENAFWYFGGVTQAIVPDNLKSAVSRADKYEPDINPEYYDFARHYQTVILPARARQPKDKALAEGAVNIVYSWIFAKLRDREFYSLKELNIAIWQELKEYNDKPMQRLKTSRKELFNETEKGVLKPLPNSLYEMKNFCRIKVQFNYHIYLSADKHYYSVPYDYRGRKVDVVYSDSNVEIYCLNIRIAFHKRDRKINGYTTIKEHMPSHHQWVGEWSVERITSWAAKIGDNTRAFITKVLETKEHPEQGFKVSLGILSLAKKYSDIRLDKACRQALLYHNYSLKSIKSTLEHRLEDQQELDLFSELGHEVNLPAHENIRGNQYYN
jgi:transposase